MNLRAGEEIRFEPPCRKRRAISVSSRTLSTALYRREAGAAATALGES